MDIAAIFASLGKLSTGIVYSLLGCGFWLMVLANGIPLPDGSFKTFDLWQIVLSGTLGSWLFWLNLRREKNDLAPKGSTGALVKSNVVPMIVAVVLTAAIALGVATFYQSSLDFLRNFALSKLEAAKKIEPPANPPDVGSRTADDAKTNDDIVGLIRQGEGGFVNDPADPGGASNYGITINALSVWRGREVTVEELKNLKREDVTAFYLARISALGYNSIADVPLRATVTNAALNSGAIRANKLLNSTLNELYQLSLPTDGTLGEESIKVINKASDADTIRAALVCNYIEFYKSLSAYARFGEGWVKRAKIFYPKNRPFTCET